jgi:hypothetical protein
VKFSIGHSDVLHRIKMDEKVRFCIESTWMNKCGFAHWAK